MPKKAQSSKRKTQNWQKLRSKIVYKNPFFQVKENLFLRPNKTKGKYYLVDRCRFVEIIPLTEDNQVYLVGQYRPAVEEYSWEIPAGMIEEGEPAEKSAQRELAEEVGFRAGKLTKMGELYAVKGHSNALGIYFLAQGLKKVKKSLAEEGEILKIKKLPLRTLKQMVFNGKIKDSQTATALFLLENYLKKR